MKSNLPSLLRWTAIFMAGFVIAWVIRTPAESNVRHHAEMTALPERRSQASKPTTSVAAVPKPPTISKKPSDAEESIREANVQLVDSQERLANAREDAFKDNPHLGYAYEAWRTYERWQQNMGSPSSEALGWWDNQKDPAIRSAMRDVTRKLLVQEIAARLSDPATRDWMVAWSDMNHANTEQGIRGRQRWWADDFVPLPNFATLPPPDVLGSLLDPATLQTTLTRFQITDDERRLIKPSIFFYLEGSAQAGVISSGGEAYYHEKKGLGITSLEGEVDTKNRRAIDLSTHTGK